MMCHSQRQRAGVVALVLALLCGVVLGVQEGASSAPLLAWSNSDVLASGGLNTRAVYQVADAQELAGQTVLGALGKVTALDSRSVLGADLTPGSEAELVVVFLGSQVDAAALRRAAQLTALQPLSGLFNSAQSAVVMPFLQSQGASMLESLMNVLQGVGVQVVGCTDTNQDVVGATRAALEASPQVLLVCSTAGTANADQALAAEVEQLAAVAEVIKDSGKRTVYMYAGNRPSPLTRRKLQEPATVTFTGFGQYTTCDALCKTQTRWLEGMLALTIAALAACAGMTCLYLLNTPTRFATVKEGSN